MQRLIGVCVYAHVHTHVSRLNDMTAVLKGKSSPVFPQSDAAANCFSVVTPGYTLCLRGTCP